MITKKDVDAIQAIVDPLMGQKAWEIFIQLGSVIEFKFGNRNLQRSRSGENFYAGDWRLSIWFSGWLLESPTELIAGCEDTREVMQIGVNRLLEVPITAIDILRPSFETIFQFEQYTLRVFPIYSTGNMNWHWVVYTPAQDGLYIGPGIEWYYKKHQDFLGNTQHNG